MISSDVPPNGKFWFALTSDERDQRDQRDEPQVHEPGNVMRDRT